MKRSTGIFAIIVLSTAFAAAQVPFSEEKFRVFDGKGNPATIDQIVKATGEYDVVFLGEQHDDAVAHAIQAEVFKRVVTEYLATRKVALSLEMFERDIQIVVNEYLNGQITEAQFLASSRPWSNYKTDYRPLIELAKEKRLTVIAANAPRRYVNMVSRGGRATLNGLTKPAKEWLAPLPYAEPSDAYAKKFKALMGPSAEAQMGIENILGSQTLWDATMAHSINKHLKKNDKALVVHLNGAFHTENRLGTVEHLLKYRSKTKALVVTMRYVNDFKTFDKTKYTDLGDFVILTAPKPKIQGVLLQTLRRMDDHHKFLTSLKADLTMVRYSAQLNVADTTTGTAAYLPKTERRQWYVRIDWIKPVEEQILVIGDKFELYRPRLNQVIEGTMSKAKDNASVRGSLSFMKMTKDQLRENYKIVYLGEEQISGGVKTWHLQMTPLVPTSYKTAELWVDGDGMPRQGKVIEQNGDSTTVLLSNIQKNITLNGAVFRLRYPGSVKKIKV